MVERGKGAMRWACSLLFILIATARIEAVMPPGELPVRVKVGFFLANLAGVNEKAETFDADVYLLFQWQDEGLRRDGGKSLYLVGEAARDKLKDIWSPQPEFVNAAKPDITNETLLIKPDGSVELTYGLSANFRTNLDLRRFPFDRQTLKVKVTSFAYDADLVLFTPNPEKLGFEPESTFEGMKILKVSSQAEKQVLAGWGETYSVFTASLDAERNTKFYFWAVFGPVILIFLISCAVFLVPPHQISERIGLCLTALLACIATQFALSFNLPQIPYMTLIDRLFLLTYGFIALNVLLVSAEMFLDRSENHHLRQRVNRLAGIFAPMAYLGMVFLVLSL